MERRPTCLLLLSFLKSCLPLVFFQSKVPRPLSFRDKDFGWPCHYLLRSKLPIPRSFGLARNFWWGGGREAKWGKAGGAREEDGAAEAEEYCQLGIWAGQRKAGCGLVSLHVRGMLLVGPFAVAKSWPAQGGSLSPARKVFWYIKTS